MPAFPDDPYRPVYHFTTDHWMNDPIPFYADGEYHIYYQHNPGAAVWGDMHWGHAVSRDLLHWEARPFALAPTPGGADHDGVWTGCVMRDGAGRYAALYTGIPHLKPFQQVQCLATSDDLTTWTKRPEPVISERPDGFGECFRDPQVFETGDGNRYMVIGGEQTDGKGGAAFLYRAVSDDLTRWEYLHPLFLGGPETGHDFECPDFFPVGDGKWLLLTSRGKTWWHLGTLTDNMRFEREAFGVVDTGPFYAAKTLVDGSGRRLLFGWIQETRPQEEQVAAGWSGVLSLPRFVGWSKSGELWTRFAPQLEALRRRHFESELSKIIHSPKRAEQRKIPLNQEIALGRFPDTCEIRVEILFFKKGRLLLQHGENRIEIPINADPESIGVHVFVDRSVIEVHFLSIGGQYQTYRSYPQTTGTIEASLFIAGSEPWIAGSVDVWELGISSHNG